MVNKVLTHADSRKRVLNEGPDPTGQRGNFWDGNVPGHCNVPTTQPSTLRGTVKWVPAKRRWCSAAGEYRQAWCNLQVKLCDPCLSALEVVTTMHYTNRRILLLRMSATCTALFACRQGRMWLLSAKGDKTAMRPFANYFWHLLHLATPLLLRRLLWLTAWTYLRMHSVPGVCDVLDVGSGRHGRRRRRYEVARHRRSDLRAAIVVVANLMLQRRR